MFREENIPNQIANADGASQLRRERMEALKLKAQKRSRHARSQHSSCFNIVVLFS